MTGRGRHRWFEVAWRAAGGTAGFVPALASVALFATLALALSGVGLAATSSGKINTDVQPPPFESSSGKISPELKTPPPGTRMHVEAGRITYNSRSQVATATGHVIIVYGRYVLVAKKVVYDQKLDRMRAVGEVRLREPGGNVLTADIAQLENHFRDGFARHLRLLLTNDSTIAAEYSRRSEGYLTVFDHVTYTRCKSCVTTTGAPLWEIRSVKVTHDEKKHLIYHRDATFEFLGVPVFYTPYLSHPDPTVKRATGFLIPSFGLSNDYGLGVQVPYFINLAPNYDLTLRPVFTSRQGPLARAEFRHRTASGTYNIDAGGIYQLDTGLPAPGNRHFRGFVRTQGKFAINDHWNWGWDGTLTTDETFMRKYNISDRTEIDNTVYLTGLKGRNYFRAELFQFQGLLSTDDNNTYPVVLPHVRYSYTFDQPVIGGELGLNADFYSLFRDQSVFSPPYSTLDQGTSQTRTVADLHWQRRMVSGLGLIMTPFASARSYVDVTQGLPDPMTGIVSGTDTTATVLPTAGVDLRYPLVRADGLGSHVLTPVAQIITSPDSNTLNKIGNEDAIGLNFDSTSLFLHDHFTGYDQFETGTRANVGFLYNLMLPSGGFLRTSFGESLHVAGQNAFFTGSGLNKPRSDIVAAAAFQPTDSLRFYWQSRFDQTSLVLNSVETGIDFNYGPLTLSTDYVNVNAEPFYGRPLGQEQIWGTADLALGAGWKVFGGIRYDLALNRPVKQLIGFGYDCDCFAFRMYYKEDYASDRDIKTSRALMLSIEFRTLGSTTLGGGL